MTKLGEWLFGLTIFFGVYFAILNRTLKISFLDDWMFEFQFLPLFLILLLGIYAVIVVLYRTLTFNDCADSAEELKSQIEEAKKDLKSKGFVFHSS